MNTAKRNKLQILKYLLIVFLLFTINSKITADNADYFSWDFTDKSIRDILYVISLDTGISIVADDTVNGNGSIRFSGTDFDTAFDSFLNSCRLYVSKYENIWIVSKFRFSNENDNYNLDAFDLYPYEIIEKLSETSGWVITFDSLPSEKISVHFRGLDKENLVCTLGKRFGNYDVIKNKDSFHLKQIVYNREFELFDNSINIKQNENNDISVDIKNAGFFDVIETLFKECGKNQNFCILGNTDKKVERTIFSGKSFQEVLKKICSQNGYSFIEDDNIFYILVDEKSKNNLITGEKKWCSFNLIYTSTDDFLPLLFKKIGNIDTIPLLDKSSFICLCNNKVQAEIQDFIFAADIKKSVYLVNLKYIKPDELLEYLPPSVNKNNLFMADNNSCLYFKGTEESYNAFLEQIEVIDKPVKRLSYDLLIIQNDKNKQKSFSSSIGARKMHSGDKNNISAVLGSVMGFNLNVITTFGINFAAELQSSIEENNTKVFADTTLHGVSGKKISFQNTNTYRYRDNNVNPETGEAIYSGVTREIITGIKMDILGWVSGDGMITSNVTASISRQGNDNSYITGNPPPTTEKLITTEVSCKSGEPVILSGLILNANSGSEKRSPIISKIPLIGRLFKNESDTEENSQMVIYLVPHIENEKSFYSSSSVDNLKFNNFTDETLFNEKIDKILALLDK